MQPDHYGVTRSDGWLPQSLKNQYLRDNNLSVDGNCEICGIMCKRVLDHDHSSGKIRGLLCGNCNWGLGNFMDNTNNLLSAIRYLEKSD